MKKGRGLAIVTVSVAAVIGAVMGGGQMMGLRLNLTASAPLGVWWVRASIPDEEMRRWQLVEVCPPAHPLILTLAASGRLAPGSCTETQTTSFLKPVAAVPGDRVTIEAGKPAIVNGMVLPNTQASQVNLSWPSGTYIVGPGQVWLFSTYSERSLDSRYFGPIGQSSVRGTATPILTVGSVAEMTAIQGDDYAHRH